MGKHGFLFFLSKIFVLIFHGIKSKEMSRAFLLYDVGAFDAADLHLLTDPTEMRG